jgi:hypothetical protein
VRWPGRLVPQRRRQIRSGQQSALGRTRYSARRLPGRPARRSGRISRLAPNPRLSSSRLCGRLSNCRWRLRNPLPRSDSRQWRHAPPVRHRSWRLHHLRRTRTGQNGSHRPNQRS